MCSALFLSFSVPLPPCPCLLPLALALVYWILSFLSKAALERGEKLSELEKKTADMSVKAQAFAEVAQKVSLKYKDKKWYQV